MIKKWRRRGMERLEGERKGDERRGDAGKEPIIGRQIYTQSYISVYCLSGSAEVGTCRQRWAPVRRNGEVGRPVHCARSIILECKGGRHKHGGYTRM